jgi:hypothetical protein
VARSRQLGANFHIGIDLTINTEDDVHSDLWGVKRSLGGEAATEKFRESCVAVFRDVVVVFTGLVKGLG